jgi:hypothetical protein
LECSKRKRKKKKKKKRQREKIRNKKEMCMWRIVLVFCIGWLIHVLEYHAEWSRNEALGKWEKEGTGMEKKKKNMTWHVSNIQVICKITHISKCKMQNAKQQWGCEGASVFTSLRIRINTTSDSERLWCEEEVSNIHKERERVSIALRVRWSWNLKDMNTFPEPVWPYAKMVEFTPSSTFWTATLPTVSYKEQQQQ